MGRFHLYGPKQIFFFKKPKKVSIMNNVYCNASRVLIWLGESDRDIYEAMTLLECFEDSSFPKNDKLRAFMPGLEKVCKKPW